MSDERPRPQYGEYATPEQQAAAMGKPFVPPEPAATAPEQSTFSGAPGRPAASQTYVGRPPGYANRFFTVFLLGLGALTLFGDIPLYINFESTLKNAYSSAGVAVVVPASVGAAGVPILIANILVYLATVVVSVLVLRRGHVAVYIPIVGLIVFGLVSSIIITIVAPDFISGLAG